MEKKSPFTSLNDIMKKKELVNKVLADNKVFDIKDTDVPNLDLNIPIPDEEPNYGISAPAKFILPSKVREKESFTKVTKI